MEANEKELVNEGQVFVMRRVRNSTYVYEFTFTERGVARSAKLVVSISHDGGFYVAIQVQLDGYAFQEDYLDSEAEDESWEDVIAEQFGAASPTQDSLSLEMRKPFHDAVERRLGILRQLIEGGNDWLRKAEPV